MTQFTWTGAGSGTSWGDPDDWTSDDDEAAGTVPGPGDTAVFGDDATITDSGTAADVDDYAGLTVQGEVTAVDNFLVTGSLNVESGGSIGAGDLVVDDSADIDDGAASVSEFVTVDDGASLSFEKGASLNAPSLTADGTVEFDDSSASTSQFISVDSSGYLSFVDDASLNTGSLATAGLTDFDDANANITQFVTVDDNGSLSLEDSASLNTGSMGVSGSVDIDDASATMSQYVSVDDNGSISVGHGGSFKAESLTVDGSVVVSDASATTSQFVAVDDDGSISIGHDGSLKADDDLSVTGGTVTISGGGQIVADDAIDVQGGGSIDIDGSGSLLEDIGSAGVTIGGASDGSLSVEDGASASFTNSDPQTASLGVGVQGGGGTVTVAGSGSTLTTSGGGLVDGQDDGIGDVMIEDGATATLSSTDGYGSLDVGYLGNGDGTFTLEGSGSSLQTSGGSVSVGADDATGLLTIEEGATASVSNDDATASSLSVGAGTGALGTLTIEGSGSSLTTSVGGFTIGYDDGYGYLYVEDGGAVSSSEGNPLDDSALEIGDDGTGTATVEGNGSTLAVTNANAAVGIAGGDGSLAIESGGAANFASPASIYSLWDGLGGLGTGLVTVEGQGSSLTLTGGGAGIGFDATGALDIEGGATGSITTPAADDSLDIGGALGNGAVKVDGSGSTLTVTGAIDVGLDGNGSLAIFDGASLSSSFSSGYAIDVGVNSDGDGTMIVGGASTTLDFEASYGITVGDAGTGLLDVDDGASLTTGSAQPNAYWGLALGNTATASGTLNVTGTNSTVDVEDGGMVVGNSGAGFVDVYDGAALDVNDTAYGLVIGSDSGSLGDVSVSGAGSTLTSLGPVLVGAGGAGTLEIEDTASFLSLDSSGPSVDIGVQSGATGTLVVDGSGTDVDLDQGDGIVIGDAGTGTMDVDDGATFTVASADPSSYYAVTLGAQTTGDGLLDVSGADSAFTVGDGGLGVGEAGQGALSIDDAATLTVSDTTYGVVVGDAEDSTGYVTVSGENSLLDTSGPLDIGLSGTGTVLVEDSATLQVESGAEVDIGVEENSTGALYLEGDDTTFDYDGDLTIGDAGTGSLTLEDGATWSSQGDVTAGSQDSGDGSIKVSGDDSALTVDGELTVGESGTGSLTVEDGASLTVRGDATEAKEDDSVSTTTIDGQGTKADYDRDDVIGSSGSADDTISGGAAVTVADDLTLGENSTGDGMLTLTGDGSSLEAGNITIGDNGQGEIDVQDGASLTSYGDLTLGDSDDSTGTLLVDGDGSSVDPPDVTVGSSGTGVVTLSNGGSLETDDLTLGEEESGDGTVTVADADSSLTVDGALEVGAAGQGLLVVDGDSTVSGDTKVGSEEGGNGEITVNVATLELDGATTVGEAGNGTILVQLGATLTAQDLTLGESAGASGTLTVQDDDTTATTGALTVGGAGQGTLLVADGAQLTSTSDSTLADTASSQISTATIESGASWTVAGGGLTVGGAGIATLTVTSGAGVSASGDIVLGEQGAATGEIDVSGLGADGVTASSLEFGGALTVGGSGKGTLNVTNGATVAPLQGGAGAIEIAAQQGSVGEVSVSGEGSQLKGDALAVGGTADAAGGAGSLTISDDAVASATDATIWGQGQVTLQVGVLQADQTTVKSGGVIAGYGEIVGNLDGAGAVTASGGELSVSGTVDATTATSFTIDDTTAGSDLVFSGSVGTTSVDPTIDFGAVTGDDWGMLDLAALGSGSAFSSAFHGVISGFIGDGSTASTSDVIDVAGSGGSDHLVWTQDDGSGALQVETSGGGVLESLTLDGVYNQRDFALSGSGGVDQIAYSPPCFCRGTRIRTARGEIAVEDLRIGEMVLTASGALRPIVWIGHRDLDVARHRWPLEVLPVRVSRNAFGDNLPSRELWLSPQHAVFTSGVLIPIIRLANGATVKQMRADKVSYWHVELESHDVLLAEGLPTESFLDCGTRQGFANYNGLVDLHPTFAAKSYDDACAPRRESGPDVEAVRARLCARAHDFGFRRSRSPGLHIVADGCKVWPARDADGAFRFALPWRARAIALASRTWRPADEDGSSASDRRHLGAAVWGLECDGVAQDLRALGRGWHDVEGAGVWRWTDSRADLPAAREIVVRLGESAFYWVGPDQVEPTHVVADGLEIWPERLSDGRLRFKLPRPARTIVLSSPTWRPADADETADHRSLGVPVRRIEIDGEAQNLAALCEGWHAMEGDGENPWRWTDGCATLPPALARIVLSLSQSAEQPVELESSRALGSRRAHRR